VRNRNIFRMCCHISYKKKISSTSERIFISQNMFASTSFLISFLFHFCSFTEHGPPQPTFFSEADRRQRISPQETGDFLSLIRQQLQFIYYNDANRTRHCTKATELLNKNDIYSNLLEGRVRHQSSLRGICGEGNIIQNVYRNVSQYSCTFHKISCFLLRKSCLRKNVSHVRDMRNAGKILVRKSERNKHLSDLAGTLQ
jgi:hypothetical protein